MFGASHRHQSSFSPQTVRKTLNRSRRQPTPANLKVQVRRRMAPCSAGHASLPNGFLNRMVVDKGRQLAGSFEKVTPDPQPADSLLTGPADTVDTVVVPGGQFPVIRPMVRSPCADRRWTASNGRLGSWRYWPGRPHGIR